MENISKLPKWAQDKISSLERQREAAIEALDKFTNGETKSRVWIAEHPCLGGESSGPREKVHYLQTRSVEFQVGKSKVYVYLREDNMLDISTGGNRLYIMPQASNVIRVIDLDV